MNNKHFIWIIPLFLICTLGNTIVTYNLAVDRAIKNFPSMLQNQSQLYSLLIPYPQEISDMDECKNQSYVDYCRYVIVSETEAYYIMKFNPKNTFNSLIKETKEKYNVTDEILKKNNMTREEYNSLRWQ